MDVPETALVVTTHPAGPGGMNYPSTTQALFALIVMIIVLVFILVYCCWGTFTCAQQDDASAPSTNEAAGSNTHNTQQGVRHILRGQHTVIVPINNMIYVGDPETHQIYQIPLDRDKPPAYTEVFRTGPPPPYRPDTRASDSELSSIITTHMEQQANRTPLPESPPAYDECLSAADPSQEQQQQQEGVATSETCNDTPASTVTESPPPPTPEPTQEGQESSPPRTDLILRVITLPQVSLQPAEEGPSNASAKPQHL